MSLHWLYFCFIQFCSLLRLFISQLLLTHFILTNQWQGKIKGKLFCQNDDIVSANIYPLFIKVEKCRIFWVSQLFSTTQGYTNCLDMIYLVQTELLLKCQRITVITLREDCRENLKGCKINKNIVYLDLV